MKKIPLPTKDMTAQDQQRLVLPVLVCTIVFLFILVIYSAFNIFTNGGSEQALFVIGCLGIISCFVLYYWVLPRSQLLDRLKWIIPVITGLCIGMITIFIPQQFFNIFFILYLLSVIIVSVINGRKPTFLMIGIVTTFDLISLTRQPPYWTSLLMLISLPLVMIAVSETILRSSDMLYKRILSMGEINEFSRKIAASLETSQVMTLLSAAIQDSLDADTYWVGLCDGNDYLQLDLVYDDGEYFAPERVPLAGTLSGWVISNEQTLFLPDLREEPDLEGIQVRLIGKNKTSLSWMGVPIHTTHYKGVIGVASYKPNAFDRMDVQLLENLGQQAGFALDNAHHHTEVEFQSQLDSLTGVYNHGFFLKMLDKKAEQRRATQAPMSVIMLDVDHFKQYNDTYGHLFGDSVLQALVNAIRSHIKSTDFIGRWGGEEFAVALPGAHGQQALMVARRIQATMAEMKLKHEEKGKVPAPTVSQGIAIFPLETDDIYKLIDIADRRLYVAKERGRNEVEPDEKYWEATIHLRR